MTNNISDFGYLLTGARTADGVLLIPNATVKVYGSDGELISEQKTNIDGYTSEIEISTPPLEYSLSPRYEKPFANVRITVEKEGFLPAEYLNVPVFPNVVTIQQTNLQPSPNIYGISSDRQEITNEMGGEVL